MCTAALRRRYRLFGPASLAQPTRTRSYGLAVARPSSNRRRPLTRAFSLSVTNQKGDQDEDHRPTTRSAAPGGARNRGLQRRVFRVVRWRLRTRLRFEYDARLLSPDPRLD